MTSDSSDTDLLIIGGGPAGLMAACCAAQYSMKTRIIDQKASRTQTGHGDGLQSRTLEILDSFGLTEEVLKRGTTERESSYWIAEKNSGHIQRVKTERSDTGPESRFPKALLNQGATEQIMLDYLSEKHDLHVERSKAAETLHIDDTSPSAKFPVSVVVRQNGENDTEGSGTQEIINARYIIACDGAHSWTRDQLGVDTDGDPKGSTWGVFDIVPITDFPDIRRSCAIHSEGVGSIMTIPRENRLVRFYTLLQDTKKADAANDVPNTLVDIASRTMTPYSLSYKYCDWSSLYTVRRHLAQKYRPHDRIFLAGDAAHSHSPLGGQGMNVSTQDSYNLAWKIGAVVTGIIKPTILDTYESERHPVAKKLMQLDTNLVQAYEEGTSMNERGVSETCEDYSGFMSGVDLTYSPSILVDQDEYSGSAIAKHVKLGRRIDSVPVTNHSDGTETQLAQSLTTNGSWRLLVFPGDIKQQARMDALTKFAENFGKCSSLARLSKSISTKTHSSILELILIHLSPITAIDLLALPDIFHPFDEELGWDYWKVFADEKPSRGDRGNGQAYEKYGIDGDGPCCIILCRPDQHVAWIGDSKEVARLDTYFSHFL